MGKINEPVVVSGMSGRFPDSDNIQEFWDHLINGDDMTTTDNEPGKLSDLSKFDAAFFGVHPKQAQMMDPQHRILQEVAYEAVADSGTNPKELRGANIGVYIGCNTTEAAQSYCSNPEPEAGYGGIGTGAVLANRISFAMDFTGPSYSVDRACSPASLALHQALCDIREGHTDGAIVGGCNVPTKPQTSKTIACVYITRESLAKRAYGFMVNSSCNTDGNKERGITNSADKVREQLLRQCYTEAGVSPDDVEYFEAQGTGTNVGDPEEVNSIYRVLCENRNKDNPLMIGSLESNMSHGEASSGMAALCKVMLTFNQGIIPPNLHYHTPNLEIVGLKDRTMEVILEPQPFKGGYVGMSSSESGGSNVTFIMKPCRPAPVAPIEIPQLILSVGRTEEGVKESLRYLAGAIKDSGSHQLTINMAREDPNQGFPYRGFQVASGGSEGASPGVVVKNNGAEKRPVWYIFTGMGSQWPGMGRDLMVIKTFRDSIQRCHDILLATDKDLDLMDMIMNGTKKSLEGIIKSFVCIASIQIALINCLREIGVEPDGMIGHSVGELGCAYADGGFTEEQTLMGAYHRGRCIHDGKTHGAMAAIGLSLEEVTSRLPEGVVAACHNSEDSVTISGRESKVNKFVDQLDREGIFAMIVDSSGIAFHSPEMYPIVPQLNAELGKVIKTRTLRSPNWISTSYPEEKWGTEGACWSDASYLVNNLISPVLFKEGLTKLPANAITVEIAPHCLMQAILKRVLPSTCDFFSLMKCKERDNLGYFLSNLGKLFNAGVAVNIGKLYPPVEYPLGVGLPFLSPGVRWDHSMSWDVPMAEECLAVYGNNGGGNGLTEFLIDSSEGGPEAFVRDHQIDERVLYPATGYVNLAWRAIARMNNVSQDQLPITLRDVTLHRATIIPTNGSITLEVRILPGSRSFEVTEGDELSASGKYLLPEEPFVPNERTPRGTDGSFLLKAEDIYKDFHLLGHGYGPNFQGLKEARSDGAEGTILWTGNWITFMDTMLQASLLTKDNPGRCLQLPTRIRSMKINPLHHLKSAETAEGVTTEMLFYSDKMMNSCTAGGVEITGIHTSVAPRRQVQQSATMESVSFVPYGDTIMTLQDSGRISEYATVCQDYIKQMLAKLARAYPNQLPKGCERYSSVITDSKIAKETYLDRDRNNYLKVLQQIENLEGGNGLLIDVKKVISENAVQLSNDRLLSVLLQNYPLKNMLDIIWENSRSRKLKFLEIGARYGCMFNHVIPALSSQPLVDIDYTASDPNVEEMETALGDLLKSLDVKTHQYDVNVDDVNGLGNADVVLVHGLAQQSGNIPQSLQKINSMIVEGGFLILHEATANHMIRYGLDELVNGMSHSEEGLSRKLGMYLIKRQWEELLVQNGFEIISVCTDDVASSLFLCRKQGTISTSKDKFISISMEDMSWLEELKTVLATEDEGRIWLIADGEEHNGIVGFVNCLLQEEGGSRIRCIFDAGRSSLPDLKTKGTSTVMDKLSRTDLVMNVYKDGSWGSYRHYFIKTDGNVTKAEDAYVNVLTRGDLTSLRWIKSPLTTPQESHDLTRCTIYYSSLNFRDIMLATGKLPPDALPADLAQQECILGLEFAGRNTQGERIMGLVPSNGLATSVMVEPHLLFDVPDSWSLEDAATVPVVYSTAYYALVVRGQLRRGESVLIHSGSGGVGQAAISIALSYGCTVYTTVDTKEKREFLLGRFPELKENSLANSHDLSFEEHVIRQTNGAGVNLVLNSLAGAKLGASLQCLSMHGRFLEIGKYDLSQNTNLGMAIFLKNTSFCGVHLDRLMEKGNPDWPTVANLMKGGIKSGVVRPLRRTAFERDEVEGAFRFMAQEEHIGKVLVKVRPEEEQQVCSPVKELISVTTRNSCHPEKVYILPGGLGGFGSEVAQWLVTRGCTKLVLTSRSGLTTGYQARRMAQWEKRGVSVTISKRDIADEDGATQLIKESQKLGPIGGIFNLAMVLRDGLFKNQTVDNFITCCRPKVQGGMNLDRATRKLCGPELDLFVMFSSISCGRGNAGQSNYGLANSSMERICEKRKADGLPGVAIQWGVIGDVGFPIESMGGNEDEVGGCAAQRIQSCLLALDTFLSQPHAVVSSYVRAVEEKSEGSNEGSAQHGASPSTDAEESSEDVQRVVVPLANVSSILSCQMNSSIVTLSDSIEGSLPIFFVHPLEGTIDVFRLLASKLDGVTCYALQVSGSVPMESVTTIAEHYLSEIRGMNLAGPFHLVGYSFGASVALEMGLQIQGGGSGCQMAGPVMLVDGTPCSISCHLRYFMDQYEPTEWEVTACGWEDVMDIQFLAYYVQLQTQALFQETKDELLSLPSYEECLETCASALSKKLPEASKEDLMFSAESFTKRLWAASKYLPTTKYNGDVCLLKASQEANIEIQGEKNGDYGLAQVCSGKVSLHTIEGNHEMIMQEPGVSIMAKTIQDLFKS